MCYNTSWLRKACADKQAAQAAILSLIHILLADAAVDYVAALTGDLQNDYPAYHCIASQTYNGGEGEVTWYLYAKIK